MIPRPRRSGAFTLVEVAVATTIFGMLGLVVYGVASEGLYAFSRNISINRSYTDARRALDRIGLILQTAGYRPQLLKADGTALLNADNTPNTTGPAAGFRVWRYSSTPCYDITTPNLTDKFLTLDLRQPTDQSVIQPPPNIGDLITIPALGFQATAQNVTSAGNSATVTLSDTVANLGNLTSIPTKTPVPKGYTGTQPTIQYYCLDWNSVAVIAIGTQLRYYPAYVPGTTDPNKSSNYRVLANLVASVGGTTPPLPFSAGPSPSLNVDLYAEAPDYNNRTRDITSANTYTFLSSAFSPRNPSLLTSTVY